MTESEKIIAIESHDCYECDGITSILIVPENINIENEYKKYDKMYPDAVKNSSTFVPYYLAGHLLKMKGVREPTENEIEVFTIPRGCKP